MMKPLMIFWLVASSLVASGQLSSTDIKDASTTGPFPLYVGLGFSNSFRNQDLVDVGKVFYDYNNHEARVKTRLYGVHAIAGLSIIPDNCNLSYVVEFRYLWLKRTVPVSQNEFSIERDQFSLGVGVRYAFFPFVAQIQVGPILRQFRHYTFQEGGERKFAKFQSISRGVNSLVRLTLLDPAGTEGGPGFYFEAGYNFASLRKNNNELSRAIQAFDPSYSEAKNAKNRYGYLAFGLILPIAIRIR